MALIAHPRWARRIRAALAPALIALTVSGCGFQLRGATPVPAALQPLAVACSDGVPTALCNAVEEQLRLGGVTLADNGNADYKLRLARFEQVQRASAVTLQGSAAEYDLRQRVWIDVLADDTIPLVAEAEIRSSETFRYDEDNVLAKQREKRGVEETLYQRLAQQILYRLSPLTEARIQALRQQAEQSANAKPGPSTP